MRWGVQRFLWIACVIGVALCPLPPQVSRGDDAGVSSLILEGIAQRNAGHHARSAATLARAIAAARASGKTQEEFEARNFLALTHVIAGDAARALDVRQANLAFARRHRRDHPAMEGSSLEVLSRSYISLGRAAEAVTLLKQAQAIAAPRVGLDLAHFNQRLGIAMFLAGDLPAARDTLWAARDAYQAELKKRLPWMPAASEYEEQVELLRWMQQVAVAQNRVEEGLELAELGRARALSALLASGLGRGAGPQSEVAPPTLAQIRAVAAAEKSWLVEYSLVYRYDPDLQLRFADLAQAPATDVLIWVVHPSGEIALRRKKLEPAAKLGDVVRSMRQALAVPGRGLSLVRPDEGRDASSGPAWTLRELYDLLIAPIADLLPTSQSSRVIFVPQDLLFLIPFAALQDPAGNWLVQKLAIGTATSIDTLRETRARQARLPATATGALVIGNPTMPSLPVEGRSTPVPLPSLPGAEAEAQAVSALLGTSALIGPVATRAAVVARMGGARVIHFATHGLLDGAQGLFSSLAFTPSAGDEGFLTAREIAAMKLDSEIVALSACDTGQGRIDGDGVLGLSRAFIGAGASSVLVSLWSVPDAPTTVLMSAFYRGLIRGEDKAQALRSAMLATMKEHASPRDWAAFMLVGEADVTKALRTAFRKGLGPASSSAASPPAAALPVPAGVENYMEFPNAWGTSNLHFFTRLGVAEAMRFYREAMPRLGLVEEKARTREAGNGFSLIFRVGPAEHTSASNEHVVVSASTDLARKGLMVTVAREWMSY